MAFSDPDKFQVLLKRCGYCVCFTATPDDGNANGPQRSILVNLGIMVFEPECYKSKSNSLAMRELKNLPARNDLEVLDFVAKKLADGPILLYCTHEFH